jgi:orotate phosphoribosyltransferase
MEGFFVRGEAKKHGTKKIIEGKLAPGWKVAILDDVATKGNSIMKAVHAIRQAECVPVMVSVLVDRLEGAGELFAKEGIPFKPIFTIEQFKQAANKS